MTETLTTAVKQARENPELMRMLDPTIPPRSEPFVRLNQNLSGLAAFGGNSVELLADYDGSIHCMTKEVDRAQRYVHMGCVSYPGYKEMLERLAKGGIQWHLMLPFQPLRSAWSRPDLRNHRKIVVVDGKVGFTGSTRPSAPTGTARPIWCSTARAPPRPPLCR